MLSKEKLEKTALSLILLLLIYPILKACFYAFPSSDDFTNSLGWISAEGSKLSYIFRFVLNTYKTWQGTYFGSFICAFPVYYIFGINGIRVFYFVIAVMFFFICFFFNIAVNKWMDTENKAIGSLLFTVIGLFYILSTNNLDEVFYWFTSVCMYELPLCFTLLCVSFYILYNLNPRKIFLGAGMVFAFLAAGGALNVTALLCTLLLFGILYNKIVLNVVSKNAMIGAVAFMGAIINAAAPGNFVRHTYFDKDLRVFAAIGNVIVRIHHVISSEFQTGFLLLIIILSFVFAYKNLGNSAFGFKYPALVTVYGYLAVLTTDFPVALGYSNLYMPTRCSFVEHMAITIYFILVSVYWGAWVSKKKFFEFSKESYFALALICIIPLSAYFDVYQFRELTPCKMLWHLAKGDFETIAKRESDVIDQIETSTESDVVVCIMRPSEGEWGNVCGIGLTEDKSNRVNVDVSTYYGKKSIKLRYTDEEK